MLISWWKRTPKFCLHLFTDIDCGRQIQSPRYAPVDLSPFELLGCYDTTLGVCYTTEGDKKLRSYASWKSRRFIFMFTQLLCRSISFVMFHGTPASHLRFEQVLGAGYY
jgi:hypothetical protein